MQIIKLALYWIGIIALIMGITAVNAYAEGLEDMPVPVMTIIGEAASEGLDGMQAVAHVLRNRARYRDKSIEQVCKEPFQFSCWNGGSERLYKFIKQNKKIWSDAYSAWQLSGVEPDTTGGADHYFADYIPAPSWSKGMIYTGKYGRHLFYKS
jgi:spore germination cell wall hydrolase CwlJ-like protein